MSDGSEFQVCGAATENARRANSVRVLAADSSGAFATSVQLALQCHVNVLLDFNKLCGLTDRQPKSRE